MEIKHKECFIPNTINYYGLQTGEQVAREAAEFVNLYSKSRGINRFPALVESLEWLKQAARSEGPRLPGQDAEGLDRVDEGRDEARQPGLK